MHTPKNVLLVGGSGFIGQQVAHLLVSRGCTVRIPTRRRSRVQSLLTLPTAEVIEANVHDRLTLQNLMEGQDTVISLVGILHSSGGRPYGRDFARAHVALPQAIARTAEAADIKRIVHVSALGAERTAPSEYLRSKADGEAAIRGGSVPWVIMRPSVVFGPGDSFLNLFANLQHLFPVMPLGGAKARMQPVYVGDVAQCIVEALYHVEAINHIYRLCGPHIYTLEQLVKYVGEQIGAIRPILSLPTPLAWLQAAALEFAPGPTLMSRDNLRSLKVDSVCPDDCSLPFGVEATPLESVAPNYLTHKSSRDHYADIRQRARR